MKKFFKNWLGIDILEKEIEGLKRELNNAQWELKTTKENLSSLDNNFDKKLSSLNDKYHKWNEGNSKKISNLEYGLVSFTETFRLGADIPGNKYDIPWAVVCFGDKNPQVHFLDLSQLDPVFIKTEIVDRFKSNRMHIDAPYRSFFNESYKSIDWVRNNRKNWNWL